MIIELVVSTGLMFFFSILLKYALAMPDYSKFWAGPGAFPVVLNALLLIMSFFWFLDTIRKYCKTSDKGKEIKVPRLFSDNKQWMRMGIISLLTIIYIYFFTPLLGFTMATMAFLVISLFVFGNSRWYKNLMMGIVVTLLVYVTFKYVLNLPMPS